MRRLSHPSKASPGFTLLELIVAFTMLSLILVMILGALRLGSAAWEKGEAYSEKYQKMRMVSTLLSQQVKSAFPYKIKATKAESDYLAYLGSRDSLRFVSTFSVKAKRSEGLVFVIYRVEERGPSGKMLTLYEQRVLNKDFLEETPEEEKFFPLLEGLSDFGFEYFQGGEEEEDGEWVESWDGKDKMELPLQVRMTATWKEKRGQKEEMERNLPTLVSIPAHLFDERGRPGRVPVPRPTPPKPK
ncbi:MAG: prepilin-type N-terminal cleavage/methylation domain-containing protein [Desulfobacterales bacterium]|nr:prepilin-type N-terminal cleavage/methylation domain-containing protein [Desulfobacterales bacterium]